MERPGKTTLALVAGIGLLLLIFMFFTRNALSKEDQLANPTGLAAAESDLNPLCSGQSVYEQIKRALFRQAAQQRSDQNADFDKLGIAASVRMENPAAENEDVAAGLVNCFGSLSIDLPPGVALASGQHYLMSDVDYAVRRSSVGPSKVVQLRNADAMVGQLAGLTIRAAPAPLPPPLAEQAPLPDEHVDGVPSPVTPPAASPTVAPAARPSFDCGAARSRSELAVCGDPGLASLDRSMTAQYRDALTNASPSEQAILRQSRNRFLAYRDRCPNHDCISDAYNGRMREIRDIMEGRWQPPR